MPDQLKKFRIVLKPLEGIDRDRIIDQIKYTQDRIVRWQSDTRGVDLTNRIEKAQSQIAGLKARLESKAERVIDADHVGYIDEGTMLAGINPGTFTYQNRCIGASSGHAERLYKKRHTPDFYSVSHSPTGVEPNDPSHTDYIVTRKFEKILSINIDNVVSINGKPIIGKLDNLDKGVQHLGLEEGWSIDDVLDTLED